MKKIHLHIKRLYQIFLYLIETLGIATLFTFISDKFIPFNNPFDIIERITVFYTLYQIIIYNILQQLNDIKKDEYLALSTMYKYVKLYIQTRNKEIKNYILSSIEYQLEPSTFNDINIRNEYLNIKKAINTSSKFNTTIIDYKIILYDHLVEEAVLNWKYSILLRIFK